MIDFELILSSTTKAKLDSLPENVRKGMLGALQDGMLLVERTSKTEYLSGPRPSKIAPVTGILRSSVHGMASWEGSNLVGKIGVGYPGGWYGMSGIIPYAKILEQGGTSSRGSVVAIRAKALKFFWHGSWWYKKRVGPATMRFPPRPYLRQALMDRLFDIKTMIEESTGNALNFKVGGKGLFVPKGGL